MKFKSAIKPYTGAAGGWGSLEATTRFVLDSKQALKNIRNLLRVNQVKGFDCPGCAWGDDNHSTFSFCENGPKLSVGKLPARRWSRSFLRNTA
uniref:Molybdopterin oxidoreductase domain-containing protein n=1 Tax=Yersinia enterocolitica W22703 TaxID=913028 RepID=F4N0W6_YEREN|nr:hypothetical protein YEW_KG44310 [Yersinia enterocolitica W22703]